MSTHNIGFDKYYLSIIIKYHQIRTLSPLLLNDTISSNFYILHFQPLARISGCGDWFALPSQKSWFSHDRAHLYTVFSLINCMFSF